MDLELLLSRAELAGQWALANQVNRKRFADCGRYMRSRDRRRPDDIPASCWLLGVEIKALLALYEVTGKEEYLASCRLAAEYLKTLQQLDARRPRALGYIVELTPQTREGHPRDALTAAWAWLILYRVTREQDLLDRALLFADWFERIGMVGDYPAWSFFLDRRPDLFAQRGSFHGGSPAFFNDLYDLTGDRRWLALARRIADFHIAHFLKPDGSLRITLAAETLEDLTFTGKEGFAWEHMHKYNDDFTALAMMRLGELTGEARYTEAGLRFANHLLRSQGPTGGFGDPVVTSAGGVGALTLFRAAQADPPRAAAYLAGVEKALHYILAEQETETDDPHFRGAFYSELEGRETADTWRALFDGGRSFVHLRTIAYSTSALAMLGGRTKGRYYNLVCG